MTKDPLKYFRVEARELADELAKVVLELERAPSVELVARALRLAHTLKGAARVVRQPEIADRAHALEDVLAPFKGNAASLASPALDRAFAVVDEIGALVTALAPAGASPTPNAPEAGQVSTEASRTTRLDLEEVDALVTSVTELSSTVASIERLAGSIGRDLEASLGASARDLVADVERARRQLEGVHEAALRLRRVPSGTMFTTLERAARDAAQALGRNVRFAGRGAEIGLDARVATAVQAALVQLVRNAVAHGIEPANERVARGKPAEGSVSVDVSRRGRWLVFTCADDGRGVDAEKVRAAAARHGIPIPEGASSSAQLLELLLATGVSTADSVTEVAGRGIGLDVVRDAVAQAGGSLRLETQRSVGTRFELVLPLSLASVDALLVEAGGVVAAIPLDAVPSTARVSPEELARTPEGETFVYERASLPFCHLGHLLRGQRASAERRAASVVIVRAGERAAGIGVDRLLGVATVHVQSLPTAAPASPLVAGVTLDVGGGVRLLLDPAELVAQARRPAPEAPSAPPLPPILIIDDSVTTRMLEQSILDSAGYDTDTAVSAEQGLEKARARRYALFLVDVEMPGMDGFTFVETARADPALRDVPAILVTSRAAPEDRRRGEEAGAQGYVVKGDFDQGWLLSRIAELVGRRS